MVLKLKELRKKFGLTQKELAEKLRTTQQTIARWESGEAEPSIASIKDLAVHLGTSVDDLLGNENVITTSIFQDFLHIEDESIDGFWGHLGIRIKNDQKSIWYPISSQTYSSLYKQFQSQGWYYTRTLNNKVLIINKTNISRLCLLDEACDQLSDDWDTEWHSLEPYPLEIFRELEVVLENDFFGLPSAENEHETSEELKTIIHQIIEENHLDEDSILNLVSKITIRYVDGHSEYYSPDIDEDITTLIFQVESLANNEDIDPLLINDVSDNVVYFINPMEIAVIEIPLLKLDEQLKKELNEINGDEEKA